MNRLSLLLVSFLLVPFLALAGSKPMTFMDVMRMQTVAAGSLSRDGKWFAYTLNPLDWKLGKRFTDLYLTSTGGGAPRRITFTREKNESAPTFSPDSRSLAFLSDREGTTAQAYLMALDGGEARRISDVQGGVASLAFSDDGKWIAILGGRGEEKQLYVQAAGSEEMATALPKHATGVNAFAWAPDSSRIYYNAPDALAPLEKKRLDLKFDVRIADQSRPPLNLWELPMSDRKARRLTSETAVSMRSFQVAKSGGWLSILSVPADRHATDLATQQREVWLLHAPSGKLERLTTNGVSEQTPIVSPDGATIAMIADDDFTYFRQARLWMRPTAGGDWKKLGNASWSYDVSDYRWSPDGRSIVFQAGKGATDHLFSLDVASGNVEQLTQGDRSVSFSFHEETGQFVLLAQDSQHPADYFIASRTSLGDTGGWRKLSDSNPSVAEFALGTTETIRWRSTDGETVEGLFVKPVGFEAGKRYPLVVQIHGGPASAITHRFAGSYSRYDHVYAANGYLVLHPNYRGSTNYGEKFRTAIVGNYFPQAFDDIMAGVDALIAQGVADPDKLGMMGWSAGGHWSNWTLTHTTRFKAISSGAGAANWVSMYAQNDSQFNREHYFGGKPYDNWDHWVAMSPIRHIKNARTPTLFHCGEADPRVPRPQSEEMHMALKKLGVATEFIVYPRMPHGLTEPRYQMVKMVSEFKWLDKWINGKEAWFDWKEILDTVPGGTEKPAEATDGK